MLIRPLACLGVLVAVSACASVSKATISDRLVELGLSRDRSVCMADELEDRLNDKQLAKFARFVSRLDKAASPLQAVASLRQIEDKRIAGAVTASAFSCAI